MSIYLSPFGGVGWQFFDNNGAPLSGGKIYTYAAGTTTPQPSYTTSAANVAHTNPIILDSAGRVPSGGEIWLTYPAYKFALYTSVNTLIATYDNIRSVGYPTHDEFVGTGSQTVFVLTASPYTLDSTDVYVNGVHQNKNTYSVSGTSLTFSEAPPYTALIEVVYS